MIIWWAAAFPGFGHLLQSKYLKGFLFISLEVMLNVSGHLNLAMIYSFTGQFERAKEVANPSLILFYIPLYLFVMWDSAHVAMDSNKRSRLFRRFRGSVSRNQIEHKRNPFVVAIWSLIFPGLGQLAISRTIPALIILSIWIVVGYFSNLLWGMQWILAGELHQATSAINPEWLLFMPSIYGFAFFDAYSHAIENNNRFKREQVQFLKRNYQDPHFQILGLIKSD